MGNATILIVDDEPDIRRLVAGILQDEGYQTCEAGHADEAFEVVTSAKPDLVVLDIWLEGSRQDGLEILSSLKSDAPLLPVIMISGHGTIETAVSAIKSGAYDFVEKPFKTDRLILMVQRALEAAALQRENQELRAKQTEETVFPASLQAEAPAPSEFDLDVFLDLPLKEARALFEQQYLTAQLEVFSGNVSKTAEFVGMERSALHRKIKSLEDLAGGTQDDSVPLKLAKEG